MSQFDISRAQGARLEPAPFQHTLIENISAALLREPSPPVLLNAPTGAGKTFILSQVLARVSDQVPTIWLWFVPFVNLVQQTEDALLAAEGGLRPVMLHKGRNQAPQNRMVVLSTAAGVARAKDRKAAYTLDGDDTQRSLNEFISLAKASELKIGLVVDEAHIGLDSTTEFGKFAAWLEPDFLVMATATPKDSKLLAFLAEAKRSAFESFPVARADVVEARLNKRYIESIIYDLRDNRNITDLRGTVLRQSWKRNELLRRLLEREGVALRPLLLVQVGNGKTEIEDAQACLVRDCGVHPSLIGMHSADSPDPVMMASIANDPTKAVLIFKQSAGTGFDAPRAFVLASLKSVNDADFATQFIGRVMRVAPAIRARYRKPTPIPPALDTAYVYLANAEAQQGYESAVQASQYVRSQLEGQTERLILRRTVSGAVHYSNKPTGGQGVFYDIALPEYDTTGAEASAEGVPDASLFELQSNGDLFAATSGTRGEHHTATDLWELDHAEADASAATGRKSQSQAAFHQRFDQRADLVAALNESHITVYPLRKDLFSLPPQLQREQTPELQNRSALMRTAAMRLELGEALRGDAIRAAQNKLKETEVHTELTQGTVTEQTVLVMTNRDALADVAQALLVEHLDAEEQDIYEIVVTLAKRLLPQLLESYEAEDEDLRPSTAELNRLARGAAYWVVSREIIRLEEAVQTLLAHETQVVDAEKLPDMMLFPSPMPLARSRKNIYGVMPPPQTELDAIGNHLSYEELRLYADKKFTLDDGGVTVGVHDGTTKLNGLERALAVALDQAPFVAWWHRNPDRKPYAVRLVRADHQNYFYPDFVVCLSHMADDEPLIRLIETKDDTKDATRKAKRVPKVYGKVLFITKDLSQLKIVNDDGTLGQVVEQHNINNIREWMLRTIPANLSP